MRGLLGTAETLERAQMNPHRLGGAGEQRGGSRGVQCNKIVGLDHDEATRQQLLTAGPRPGTPHKLSSRNPSPL